MIFFRRKLLLLRSRVSPPTKNVSLLRGTTAPPHVLVLMYREGNCWRIKVSIFFISRKSENIHIFGNQTPFLKEITFSNPLTF